MIETKEKFIKFLKDNCCEVEYLSACASDYDMLSLLEDVYNETILVSGYFSWQNSLEGVDYWADIHQKWLEFCTKDSGLHE